MSKKKAILRFVLAAAALGLCWMAFLNIRAASFTKADFDKQDAAEYAARADYQKLSFFLDDIGDRSKHIAFENLAGGTDKECGYSQNTMSGYKSRFCFKSLVRYIGTNSPDAADLAFKNYASLSRMKLWRSYTNKDYQLLLFTKGRQSLEVKIHNKGSSSLEYKEAIALFNEFKNVIDVYYRDSYSSIGKPLSILDYL